ncbi:probable 3-hydroxyisobutyrate dehydrogenase, mitochondrial isoform X2 [Miscanthus floridulus]|uniref:probable 3-hydroxyisobutyrate dehydrogenase, mitochondrial isoform X2 n=1 Tax=Miscanthus floridulus TaxID=154761 RepID=UPI0034598A58
MVGFGWRVGSKLQRWGSSCLRGFSSAAVPSQLENVGFIGLGNMGSHMARNLITAGYKVTVHDINENSMKKFSDDGIPTKQSPLEVSESSDVIITMLPSSTHVLDVYNGPNGLLCGGERLGPWLYVDSSTVDPQTSRKISTDISRCHLKEKKGYAESPMILDAPVSGGVPAAEAGKLTFMVGGLEEAYLAAKPLLLAMGKKAIYCGGAGNGSAAKICNNMAMAISMLGVSEALALGQNLGIKATTLTDIFNCSSARCWSRLKIWIWPWLVHLESASNAPWVPRHLKFTESCARMAVNSKTSRVHSDITMLARMKSDLEVTLQIFLL